MLQMIETLAKINSDDNSQALAEVSGSAKWMLAGDFGSARFSVNSQFSGAG